jgi:hypothetical protein
MRKSFLITLILTLTAAAHAQTPDTSLARHDFVYSGESHERRIFIVRHGAVTWSYDDPAGKGEISDCVRLSNGNLLIAHQFGVKLITPEKKILWSYEPPPAHEVHTAVPIGTEHVLYIQNGEPAVVRVVNVATGAIEKEFSLVTKQPVSVHGQFRHARLTPQGTLLVAHMDLAKVVEYDVTGKELWSFPAPGAWGVEPLASGNVLITDRQGVREITRRGDAVWSWKPADTPDQHFVNLQNAWRLPNGNTVINSWSNEWTKDDRNRPGQMQAIELTPDKQVVWVLQSWSPPANLGPATTIQFLDQSSVPENVHFGDIH